MEQLIGFLPIVVVQLVFAIPAALLARRLDANPITWTVLTLIPFVGFFFMYYIGYRVVATVLDRLNALAAAGGVPRSASGTPRV